MNHANFQVDPDSNDNNRELPEAIRSDCKLDPPTFEALDSKTDSAVNAALRWKAEDEEAKQAQFLRGENGKQMVPIIALEADVNRVPKQRFACISVIKPDMYETLHHGERKYKGLLVKIRGIFETRDAADSWIRERILPLDPHFDVHLIECHKWSGVEDDDVHEREYADENISAIMTNYFKEEHNKQLGLQTRVEVAKNMTQRSKESGDFYRESNALAVDAEGEVPDKLSRRATMPHEQLAGLPAGAQPISLDSLRHRMMPPYTPRPSIKEEPDNFEVEGAEESCSDDDDILRASYKPTKKKNAVVLSTFLDN